MLTTDEPCDRMKVLTINYNRVVRRCPPGVGLCCRAFRRALGTARGEKLLYTEEQYEYLRMCADGLVWEWFKDANGDEVLRFLMDEGLVAAREDIRENLLCLTQKGKIALSEEAAQVNRKAKRRRDEGNITKKTKPIDKPVKAEENVAEEKGKRAHDYAVAIAPVVVTQVLEHWRNLVDLVQKLIRALCG